MVQLLLRAQAKNKVRGITGLLIHQPAYFMQYLEGSADEVKALYERIKKDTRHMNTCILDEGNVKERMFSNWNMAFIAPSFWGKANLPGHLKGKLDFETLLNVESDFAPIRVLKSFGKQFKQ